MEWTDLKFFSNGQDRIVAEHIARDMNDGKIVLPDIKDIMAAFEFTPFNKVKVVILGQDPYPNKRHAMGLAFSIRPSSQPGDNDLPRSLENIYKELRDDTGVNKFSGSLITWADEGVLLLNTSLTVIEGEPGSHSKIGWDALTKEAIQELNDKREHLVFILWGKHAQKLGKDIDRTKHLVLESAHPSPLSASRGFFGSKPFSKTNSYLQEHNIPIIHW
jgi:uracil-DNA glycosylase